MSLIELMIVIGILGVLFAAVFLFFTKGTEQFHFARRQNELATSGRLALEIISDEIIWAGYMPQGGWTEDLWHPVETATNTTFQFYADVEPYGILQDHDYRNIFLGTDEMIHITDDGSMDHVAGFGIVDLQFNYLDAVGNTLTEPLSAIECDAVRHIEIKITLQDEYMGDVYQTVMKTTITPMNLGVVHNFDPLFYQPQPLDAKIVVNVDGTAGSHSPTIHQTFLVNKLDFWGFTMVQLADDELAGYDYDSSGVDLVILRNIEPGDHTLIAPNLQALTLPIICLDPDDADDIFGIGHAQTVPQPPDSCHLFEYYPHGIHDLLPDSAGVANFIVYDTLATVMKLDSLYDYVNNDDDPYLITGLLPDTVSGVSVRWEFPMEQRRIFYCAPELAFYSYDRLTFLHNVIYWSLPIESSPDLGIEVELEGFEGDAPGDIYMTLWEDDLEGGEMLPDSIPIYTDFETGGAAGMFWVNSSTGSGQITRLADNTAEMDRSVSGAFDRNIAATAADISAYSPFSDDLYITVDSWKGNSETINAEDGVFLIAAGGSSVELVHEDFESLVLGNGDVEFWGDLYGRSRVHAPGWNNATTFATLDARVNGNYARSRMIIEVDTSTLADGTSITVYFRMADHGDETHSFNSTSNAGDYVGWSLGDQIGDTVEDYDRLYPGSYSNGVWDDYEYTFTPSGAMPSTLYVIFSQYDNYTATSATASDGMSFDDIYIIADTGILDMDRIGVPSASADWQRIAVDLDDEAVFYGVPFTTDVGIALSQYGMGPWDTYGMHWRNFELGVIEEVYSLAGWEHQPVTAGATDDWTLEDISGNHKWTLHANNSSSYSSSTTCWLSTPEFSIPTGAEDALLSFDHAVQFEKDFDHGWIEVSTNGGGTWQVVDLPEYNGSTGGHEAFTGTVSTTNLQIDLTPWLGQNVKFRFQFQSDLNNNLNGWTLDNFEATCTVSGVSIESIGFKPDDPSGGWYFNQVDVWLGAVTDTAFPSDGEWDKGTLTYAGSYTVMPPSPETWADIVLDEPFILPEATNLLVILEMNQTGPAPGYNWFAGLHTAASRWATSSSSDPSFLTRADVRPSIKIGTTLYGDRYVDQDSASTSMVMPLAYGSMYGDFEAIYLMNELGFSGEVTWQHGGTNDDWEFGAPLFTPDPDPNLVPANENTIAGNDLTDDGNYMAESWNWLVSCPYDMAEAAAYDSVAVSFDRCLRRSHNDKAYVYMAFTYSAVAPTDEAEWILVKDCDYDDNIWTTDVIQLTSYFEQARADGKTYYFIRFVMDSGIYAENGGWNLDNVGFYGRYAI